MSTSQLEPQKDPFASLLSVEAERGLLGALFMNNRAYEHVADILTPDDFSYAVHGKIYGAIGSLITSGSTANPVTLKAMFDQDGILQSIGGAAYLTRLANCAVTALNSRCYAETIADLARRREIVLAAQDIIVDAAVVDVERPANTVLDEAEERLYRITDRSARENTVRSLGDVLVSTIKAIEDAYKRGGAITTDTGLVDLDHIISGMGAGDLVVLAGRPAMGKSAAAGTIAFNAARAGKTVLIFSLEMSQAELSQRWLAGLSGISTDRQRHGKLAGREWEDLVEANAILSKLPIMVDDQPRLSVPQMRQRARRVRRRRGLDLIIIDHLQLVRQQGKQESRRVEIGDASSMLKAIAKELQVPVLLLSQLSRAPEQRDDKRPQLSDLKESGDIEQDADVVMFLFREEYYLERAEPRRRQNETREAFEGRFADWQDECRRTRGLGEIAVAKNRHGRTGVAHVVFDGERQRFENQARG